MSATTVPTQRVRRKAGQAQCVTPGGTARLRRHTLKAQEQAKTAQSTKETVPALGHLLTDDAGASRVVEPTDPLPHVANPSDAQKQAKSPASTLSSLPAEGDPSSSAAPATFAVPPTSRLLASAAVIEDAIANLANLHRSRMAFISAKVKIELQIKAIQRQEHARAGCEKAVHAKCPGVYKLETTDTMLLRQVALEPLEAQSKARLKAMLDELPALPQAVLDYADSIHGFGLASLAQIVAEAGNLSRYANPAKLWSRMGLGLSPEGGTRYEGRSPRRRAIMAVIGGNFVKAAKGTYRELYDLRKEFERTKPPCGKQSKQPDGSLGPACIDPEANCCRPGHVNNRTLRWVEKRLLLNLWRVWVGLPPKHEYQASGEAA